MIQVMYGDVFEMPFRVRLAFRDDSDKYLGSKELWASAQNSIKKIADKLGFDYRIDEGEATFYGPKIEFVVKDALGRENQCGTIQLDFVQPERFGLEYTDETGNQVHPVMIHKALLGLAGTVYVSNDRALRWAISDLVGARASAVGTGKTTRPSWLNLLKLSD